MIKGPKDRCSKNNKKILKVQGIRCRGRNRDHDVGPGHETNGGHVDCKPTKFDAPTDNGWPLLPLIGLGRVGELEVVATAGATAMLMGPVAI
jgi:hypothetical protein